MSHHQDRYVARCVEVMAEAHGASIQEAQANLVKVLQVYFETGGAVPSPAPAFVDILDVPIDRVGRTPRGGRR